jgi:hypothetical protein
MTEDLLKEIKILKTKLFSLEDNYTTRIKTMEERDIRRKRLESKISDLVALQLDVVKFRIGDVSFSVSDNLIQSCPYDNIFRDIISSVKEIGKSVTCTEKVFIDRNPKHFIYILEIMRKSFSVNKVVLIPSKISSTAFIEDIHFYFKGDSDTVLEDFEIKQEINKKYVTVNINIDIIDSCMASTNLPSENLEPYRASSYMDIKKSNSAKAYFVSYDSEFIVSLKQSATLTCIELKPFTFDLDSWYPGEGAGTFIFSSTDNVNWDFLSTIPEDYGADMESIYYVNFSPRNMRYIKFQTGDFTLSISYLKVS